ncbi:hypothetical protein KOR42_48150 [Thalassoglobus neptunius]|uniref:Uncharacterized protein n=1 Tax=Thalassoglobus neptunius TaxID=1938619 RepID=A0A5C5VV99_9PLAN|nr:hypothetical protein KOR42_48150 [Thalassoglobus neptunius]
MHNTEMKENREASPAHMALHKGLSVRLDTSKTTYHILKGEQSLQANKTSLDLGGLDRGRL